MALPNETTLFVMNVLPLTAKELADRGAVDDEEPEYVIEPLE